MRAEGLRLLGVYDGQPSDEAKRARLKRNLRDGAKLGAPFPDDLRDLTCGAKTRAGSPCKMKAIYGNGRCKLHGGLSTGPTSTEGKARSARNGKRKKRTP